MSERSGNFQTISRRFSFQVRQCFSRGKAPNLYHKRFGPIKTPTCVSFTCQALCSSILYSSSLVCRLYIYSEWCFQVKNNISLYICSGETMIVRSSFLKKYNYYRASRTYTCVHTRAYGEARARRSEQTYHLVAVIGRRDANRYARRRRRWRGGTTVLFLLVCTTCRENVTEAIASHGLLLLLLPASVRGVLAVSVAASDRNIGSSRRLKNSCGATSRRKVSRLAISHSVERVATGHRVLDSPTASIPDDPEGHGARTKRDGAESSGPDRVNNADKSRG